VTGDVAVNTNVLKVDTSNNRVGIKTASPSYSLDAGSATDAFFVPKGTTAQRPSAAAGLFRYNTSLGRFEGYTDAWGEIGGGGANTFTVDNYTTADNSTTAFTLSQTPNSEDNLMVFVGGVFQNPNDYVLNGTTLTLDEAPPSGTRIIVYSVRAAVSGSNLNTDQFTCNGGSGNLGVNFTLSIAPVSENNTQVFLDGVYQQKTDYSVSGTTLTMDTAPTSGAILEVMTFTQTDINVPVNDTIKASHLNTDIISGLTEVTAVSGDKMMILDATDSALKKTDVNTLMATAVSISSSADAVALTFDSNENATFAGKVTATGGASNNNDDANILTLNATQHARLLVDTASTSGHRATLALESNGQETTLGTTGSASDLVVPVGDFTLDVAGDIILDADGDNIFYKAGGSTFYSISNVSGNTYLGVEQADKDLFIRGNDSDGGGAFTALTLDMSEGGRANFNNDIGLSDNRAVRLGSNDDAAIYNDGSNTYIKNATVNQDIIFQGNDDGSAGTTALTLDMSDGGTATFNSHIRLGDNKTLSLGAGFDIEITSDGTAGAIATPNGTITLDSAARIDLSADDNGEVRFFDGSLLYGQFKEDSNNFIIQSVIADADIYIQGNDNSTVINAVQFDMSEGGIANFNAQVRVPSQGTSAPAFAFTNDTDTGISRPTSDAVNIIAGGTERLRINSSGAAGAATLQVKNNRSDAFNHVQENLVANLTNGETLYLGVGKANSTKNTGYVGYTWDSDASNNNYIHLSHWGSNSLFRVYGNGDYYFAGSNVSDRDKKENIKEVSGTSLDKITQIPIKSFRMKSTIIEGEEIRNQKTGFIAQEVQPLLPDVVTGTDGQGDMGIDTVGVIAHLVRAIKELEARVKELEG
jgi:hypothetical protein